LSTAARAGVFGRYQCEAAIQSVHIQTPITGRTNHEALATLYRLLAERCPGIGVLVAQAAAMVEAGQASQAIEVLDRLVESEVSSYQPYWVARANARAALGDQASARQAFQMAIGLSEDPAIRAFLAQAQPEA
jgi:RNA polymerase sigma-70 factor (ECF subfamily)